ncbi:MAG: hypothetical protein Kow00107_11300 [Planctomycetota bacterium]
MGLERRLSFEADSEAGGGVKGGAAVTGWTIAGSVISAAARLAPNGFVDPPARSPDDM